MTSRTDTTTPVSTLEGQAELFDLDAELVELTEVEAASAQADLAATASRAARKEQRAMTTAWVMLFAGLVLSLGSFASIAWHDSVAANGPSTSVATTTTP